MLTEIKKLLIERKTVSLYDLCVHFNSEATAMEKMLEVWIHKGKLRKKEIQNTCGSCHDMNCQREKMIMYEWNE
ncbi:MAG: FeoC-like transcriptional regulator [Candidatus Omnitrophica bacterium]|nr:FeoC-like transcriptional regulator [Candidatus Omnitrophota bacterium]